MAVGRGTSTAASDVASTISSNATIGGPGWLSSLDIHTANFVNGKGAAFIVILAVLQAAIGLLVLLPGTAKKIAVSTGIVLSLIFWFVGQSLGTYFSGLATDPNSAPLLILLGFAVLGSSQLNFAAIKVELKHYKLCAALNTLRL